MSETTGWSAAEVLRDFADIVETYETGKQAAAAMRVMADIEAQLAAASPDTAAPVDATLTGERIWQAWHGTDEYWGGCADRERVWRVLDLLAQRADVDHAKIEAVRALHVPWYEINGVRHDFTVGAYGDDVPEDHVCQSGPGHDECVIYDGAPEDSEHNVLACSECRQATEHGEAGHLFWPCPTILALGDATTTRPPPCPSQWAKNRGVHCAEREGHPGQHGNGVVSWSEAEAAG